MIAGLEAKKASLGKKDVARSQRLGEIIKTLEKRLYIFESDPTGNGPAGAIIANSYRMQQRARINLPFNAYNMLVG